MGESLHVVAVAEVDVLREEARVSGELLEHPVSVPSLKGKLEPTHAQPATDHKLVRIICNSREV